MLGDKFMKRCKWSRSAVQPRVGEERWVCLRCEQFAITTNSLPPKSCVKNAILRRDKDKNATPQLQRWSLIALIVFVVAIVGTKYFDQIQVVFLNNTGSAPQTMADKNRSGISSSNTSVQDPVDCFLYTRFNQPFISCDVKANTKIDEVIVNRGNCAEISMVHPYPSFFAVEYALVRPFTKHLGKSLSFGDRISSENLVKSVGQDKGHSCNVIEVNVVVSGRSYITTFFRD